MGAETNLSSLQLEPTKLRETETLPNDDQNWMSALRESVSFGRFLSEPLEWHTTGHVSPATMAHVQSPPTAELDLPVHIAAVGPQSVSNCGDAYIGSSGPAQSCNPCLPAARSSVSATHIGGADLYMSLMEPMESFGQSVGSTTPIALEDDANSSFTDAKQLASCGGDSYSTPRKTSSMPICGSIYVPECDESLEPAIGMVFDKWEAGEMFYTRYAHEVGFSVRRFTQHKGDGGVPVWKRFVCARQGWREEKYILNDHVKKPRRKVKLTRCGCEAMISLKIREDGKYEVARFVREHTHQLVSPSKKQFLRSNREVTSELRSTFFTCRKALMGPCQTYRFMTAQKGGPENIGCTKCDLQNYCRDISEIIKDADAQTIIDAMRSKQRINPTFFFDYEQDDEKKLTHIFWADGACRKNYALFGEVMSFDSTYSTNQYNLVFAPFTGVNHHKACVTFGAAFVCHEKVWSYKWLFKTFFKAMGGVAPKLIITDEDQSMKAAIKEVFPQTVHRLCMWHILYKLRQNVGHDLFNDEDFRRQFSACVWGSETPEEFEEKWSTIISHYELESNIWLAGKFGIRHLWIPAYFKGVFLGGLLRTTSRSESENAFFGHFLNRRLSLLEFWIRFESAIEEQRQKELEDDNSTIHTLPLLETTWSIESHARHVYTHTIFLLFQDEVIAARDRRDVLSIQQVGEVQITCISDLSGKVREVLYSTTTKVAHCSCKLFESIGIPCSHIIIVLKREKFKEIPSHYILHRWTKLATKTVVLDSNGNTLEGTTKSLPPNINRLYSETCTKFNMGMMAAKNCEEKMQYLHKGIANVVDHVLHMGTSNGQTKIQEFESFIGVSIPREINIHPPAIAHTKGSGTKMKQGFQPATSGKKKKRSRNNKNDQEN
ncbi:hypothetical protein VPH35_032805 [Triticum aestivum]|uniref:protein FAR1-RELATED SEQUENCE 5 isoform X1 n=1 Tax=Triticum aestivum TaxID=4565 RepID=UPI00084253AC|nr:protein FAR1-RELATED SEQUENCE 5-like isoform X1 [Triticum aestivum]